MTTITQLEAALLAANVYGNLEAVRTPQNTIQTPEGWGLLDEERFKVADQSTGFDLAPEKRIPCWVGKFRQGERK